MKLKIRTPNGTYKYTFVPIYEGVKPINKKIAKENLLLLKKIMDNHKLTFLLAYGSLLGAVREKDFIEHDEDIDLMMSKNNMPRFLSTLFELRESGFEIIRYESRGFLSIMRKGEYIDIYFFSEYEHNSRLIICCMDICPQKFLTETTIINFLGAEFKVPKDYEKYLEFNYGKNWKEPMAKFNFGLTGSSKLKSKIIQYIKAVIPEKIAEYIQSKKEKNYQQNCLVKVEKFL